MLVGLITHYYFCYVLMERNSWSVHFDMESAKKSCLELEKDAVLSLIFEEFIEYQI